jgi:general secretion pathway protein G
VLSHGVLPAGDELELKTALGGKKHMNTRRIRRDSGFTLVEILIVVIILGILAAIVIPQFTNASDSARTSSIQSQLQTIRSQIQLYKVQHLDNFPVITTSWNQLTEASDQNATIPPATGQTPLGPYLQQAPINPYNNSSTIAAAAGTGVGWVYTAATGSIQATDQNNALTSPIDGY